MENFYNAMDENKNTNTWDDGKKGNYWDDYKEKYPDAKKKPFKGIWDTPYEIPGEDNLDMFPLTRMNLQSDSINKPKLKTQFHNILFRLFELLPKPYSQFRYLFKINNTKIL